MSLSTTLPTTDASVSSMSPSMINRMDEGSKGDGSRLRSRPENDIHNEDRQC